MSEVLQIYIISMIDPENRRAEHICGHEERAGFASYEERMSANKRWVRARRVASCRVLSRPSLRHKRHNVSALASLPASLGVPSGGFASVGVELPVPT